MGFNTLPFIFIFLPVFLAVYYLMPERLRNGVLTLGSLVFYLLGTWKRPWCLALLLGLMALTWLSGRKLAGSKPLLVGNLSGSSIYPAGETRFYRQESDGAYDT